MKRPRMLITGIVVGLIALSAIAYGLASANGDDSEPRGEYGFDVSKGESLSATPTPRSGQPAAGAPGTSNGGTSSMCAMTATNCSDVPGIAPVSPGAAAAGSTCLAGATTCADNPAVAPVAPTTGSGSGSSGVTTPGMASPPNQGIAVGEPTPPSGGGSNSVPPSPPSPSRPPATDGSSGATPVVPTDPNGSVASPPQPRPTGPVPTPTTAPSSKPGIINESGREAVPAPVDGADVIVMESSPPKYAVKVLAGLPGGCAKPAGYEIERIGDLTTIAVYVSVPTANVACTAIYGTYALTVPLTGNFQSGKTYTVIVGNKVVNFTAQ